AIATEDEPTIRAAHAGLVTTIAQSRFLGTIEVGETIHGIDAGPDDWLLMMNPTRQLVLWDISEDRHRAIPLGDIGGPASQATFTRTGQKLITIAEGGPLTVWSLQDRAKPQPLGSTPAGSVAITAIATNRNGTRLFTGDKDGGVAIWDLTDPARPALLGTASP